MTNKRNKFYQIGFFALAFAFITLCAYMGITAIQKSMTLNLSMQAKPSISCAIYINESLVFDNVTPQIADGVELTANTLKLNTTSVFGQSFNLKIENKNENAIYVTFSGATISGSTNYKTIINKNTISNSMALSSAGTVTITMQQVVKVTTTPTNCTYTTDVSSGLISVSGSSYIPYGATLKQTFTSNTGYTSPPSINASMGGQTISNPDYTNEGLLTISNVTGDIVVNASCGAITYTVAYYSNDGNTLITSETHTYGQSKNLYSSTNLTPPSGKRFSGWAETSGGAVKYTDGQSVNNLTTTNGATINLYAVWEDVNVSITYNLISCDTSIEEYPTTIPYMNNRENLVLNFYGYDYDTSHSSPNSWGTFYNPPLTVTIGTVIMAKDTDFSYRIWSKGYGDDILTLTINASVITSDIVIDLTCNGSRVCCVSADTMITLSDGSEKRADEIQIGDLVMTYNFETGELEGKPILSITNALRTMQVVLKFSDNTFIKISNDHPLLTELGWKAYHPSACEFAYGDMIKVCEESFVLGDKLFSISTEYNKEIVDIEFEYCEGETFKMYTFMVEDNHNYFSNNVLSHNVACPI